MEAITRDFGYSCSFCYSQVSEYENILKNVFWNVIDLIVVQKSTK